jgi:hypothetical protein
MARTTGAKGRAILNSKKVFPEFNQIDYDASIAKNLCFYNDNVDGAVKKATALAYWKSKGLDTKSISRFGETWFNTAGAVAHMLFERKLALHDKDISFLDTKFAELNAMKEADEPATPKVTKEDKDARELKLHIAEFEAAVDVIFAGGVADGKAYLLHNEVKPAMAKQIALHLRKYTRELKEIDTDEQLKEGYSFLGKRKLKEVQEKLEALISACGMAAAITRAAKPRAKKQKSPVLIAKNVKYLSEYAELKLKSVTPDKMVNASEVWLFNVKVRRLFKYVSLGGTGLTIKGTTILNFDPEKSGGKIIRKPETQLKGVEGFTSRPLNKLYNDIRAVPSKATGRVNEDCIIVKCF